MLTRALFPSDSNGDGQLDRLLLYTSEVTKASNSMCREKVSQIGCRGEWWPALESIGGIEAVA